jgi:hypothetical protein
MSLFDNICESTLEEMAAPKRGGVGIPGEVLKSPAFASKEKFGGQAGKYTGAQMLQYLGEFLKDRGNSEVDYQELKDSIRNFLKNRGFGGTAAEYWTRTLSQTIFDFGYKPEKPSEVNDGEGEPEEFEDSEVPEITDSPESSTEETPQEPESKESEPEPKSSGEFSDTEGAELDLTDLQQTLLDLIEAEGPLENNELVSKIDRSLIPSQHSESDASIKSYLRSIAAELGRKGLVKRTDEGWTAVPRSASGSTLDELGDEEDVAADLDRAQQAELARLQRMSMGGMTSRSPLEDSVDFKNIYSNIFKSKGLIQE